MNFTKTRNFGTMFQRLTALMFSFGFAVFLLLSYGTAAHAGEVGTRNSIRAQSGSVVEQSKQRIKDAANTVKDKLDSSQDRNDGTVRSVKDRANERVEKAKDVFEEATDKVFNEPFDNTVGR